MHPWHTKSLHRGIILDLSLLVNHPAGTPQKFATHIFSAVHAYVRGRGTVQATRCAPIRARQARGQIIPGNLVMCHEIRTAQGIAVSEARNTSSTPFFFPWARFMPRP